PACLSCARPGSPPSPRAPPAARGCPRRPRSSTPSPATGSRCDPWTEESLMSVLDALPDGITGIDTYMGGASEITAGFLVAGERPALIETGPWKGAGAIANGVARAGLDPADLAWIVVTHIHLDHAGGVGDLVRTFPNATVVVHPPGARPLGDPARLVASPARVYGPLMDTVYGGLTPVEAARIKAAEDEEVIDLGGRRLELLHAPGHAKHHVAVFEPDLGALFAGDG